MTVTDCGGIKLLLPDDELKRLDFDFWLHVVTVVLVCVEMSQLTAISPLTGSPQLLLLVSTIDL